MIGQFDSRKESSPRAICRVFLYEKKREGEEEEGSQGKDHSIQ